MIPINTPSTWSGVMNKSKTDCCPTCWSGKRKCERTDTGCCRSCINYLREQKIYDQSSIKHAALLYNPAIHEQLFKNAAVGSLTLLDTTGWNSNTLTLQITSSVGPVIEFSQQISGPFRTQNKVVLDGLNRLARRFSSELRAKEGGSELISTSSLAGGYTHLLCSVITITEAANTSRDGLEIENEYNGYNLAAHFKYILVCRLQELIGEILNVLRFEDQGLELPYWCSDAYAAGVILRREMDYFKSSIRNGHLREHIPNGTRLLLFGWFSSIERELGERLRQGCGRFTCWRVSSVEGPLKSLRRHGETLDIAMHLQLNHHTTKERSSPYSVPSPYNAIGHGCSTLALPVLISNGNSAMSNDSQPFILAEPIASDEEVASTSRYLRKPAEDSQVISFVRIDPPWENPDGFSKPEFYLPINEQSTINPQYLSLQYGILGNQTIYETLN